MTAGTPGDLSQALARHGLITRGGFHFTPDEARPEGPNGRPAVSLILTGHAGGAIWPHFSAWLEKQAARPANPLDAWSAEVIGGIAERFGAKAVFPWQKPYLPFQQWAKRGEGLKPSPLGMLIHPEFGLWHAYRGALVFDVEIAIQQARVTIHPCDECVEKPCLSTCPVDAFSPDGFDAAGCRSYLDSSASRDGSVTQPDCMNAGCRARDACPVGRDHRYPDTQVQFHMAAFARAGRA
jgi:hypothetical protein